MKKVSRNGCLSEATLCEGAGATIHRVVFGVYAWTCELVPFLFASFITRLLCLSLIDGLKTASDPVSEAAEKLLKHFFWRIGVRQGWTGLL